MNESYAAHDDAERRAAQHSAARANSTCTTATQRTHTHMCCARRPQRTALPFVPTAWRFFFVLTALGGSLWPVLASSLCGGRWPFRVLLLVQPVTVASAALCCFLLEGLVVCVGGFSTDAPFKHLREVRRGLEVVCVDLAEVEGPIARIIDSAERSELSIAHGNTGVGCAAVFLELAYMIPDLAFLCGRGETLALGPLGGCRRVPGWTLCGPQFLLPRVSRFTTFLTVFRVGSGRQPSLQSPARRRPARRTVVWCERHTRSERRARRRTSARQCPVLAVGCGTRLVCGVNCCASHHPESLLRIFARCPPQWFRRRA